MGKHTCHCLNVHISTKQTDTSFKPSIVSDVASLDDFFLRKLLEVQLSLEGVKVEHPYLVKTRQVGDWLLHKCVSCDYTTHATHCVSGSDRVLINTDILSDTAAVDNLTKSLDFSPLYKILLPNRNDTEPVRSLGVQSERYESLQKTLGNIQQQLNTYLVQEEAAMEIRIKNYMERERNGYAELQSKVRRHKNTMVNLVLASEQRHLSESLSDAMTDSPTSPLSPTQGHSSEEMTGSEAECAPPVEQEKQSSTFSHVAEDVSTTKAKKLPSLSERLKMGSSFQHVQQQKITSTVDPDGDLDFDCAFQDDNNQPFYMSDDEMEDTDDSESEVRGSRHARDNQNLYSASVPISVPMWGRSLKKSFADEVPEEDPLPQDGASMAASIKAMAQSVHGDGTEMFGELPRPRLNTSNFCIP